MPRASTTADTILDCTRTLIATGGYNGFSYADIAAVVAIRKASIHHHFPTKADLVRTLITRYRGEAAAGLAALERNVPDPLDQLRAYIGHWRACIADASSPFCICALLACEIPALPADVAAEVRAHFRALSGWITKVLARGTAAGRVRLSAAPETEAEAFLATVHGAMLSARAYGDPTIFATITDPLLERLTPPT